MPSYSYEGTAELREIHVPEQIRKTADAVAIRRGWNQLQSNCLTYCLEKQERPEVFEN